jgi:hypothetical protein
MALVRKAPSLLALRPDIAVVQECSKKSVDDLRIYGFSGLWFGASPNKGIAVFCGKGWKPKAVAEPFGKWVVPVQIRGAADFNLLAVWACPVGTKRADNYIGEVHRCLAEHRVGLVRHPLSPLETSTAMCNGMRTDRDGTTQRWFVCWKAMV